MLTISLCSCVLGVFLVVTLFMLSWFSSGQFRQVVLGVVGRKAGEISPITRLVGPGGGIVVASCDDAALPSK